MPIRGYYLGCPGWSTKTWVGRLFPTATRPTEFLELYARVFNAVEGNTTFYALPTAETVARWRDQTPPTFRFCFKFPREVTHDKLLVDCAAEVATFLDRVTPLGERLGTLFLQLPPRFDAGCVARLAVFLATLPPGLAYAVELRHEVFFADTAAQRDVFALLRERGIDLVIMDTRGLHSGKSLALAHRGPANQSGNVINRDRKPNLPVVARALAARPFVRCVPHEVFAESERFVEPWARQVATWIAGDKRPYFFMHAPDDTFAPENAYAFHAMVRAHADVGELPPWPGGPRQLGLFG